LIDDTDLDPWRDTAHDRQRLDEDHPVACHGIACVQHEVEKRSTQSNRITTRIRKRGLEFHLDDETGFIHRLDQHHDIRNAGNDIAALIYTYALATLDEVLPSECPGMIKTAFARSSIGRAWLADMFGVRVTMPIATDAIWMRFPRSWTTLAAVAIEPFRQPVRI
jgi:hypothetical protein